MSQIWWYSLKFITQKTIFFVYLKNFPDFLFKNVYLKETERNKENCDPLALTQNLLQLLDLSTLQAGPQESTQVPHWRGRHSSKWAIALQEAGWRQSWNAKLGTSWWDGCVPSSVSSVPDTSYLHLCSLLKLTVWYMCSVSCSSGHCMEWMREYS